MPGKPEHEKKTARRDANKAAKAPSNRDNGSGAGFDIDPARVPI